MSQRESLEPGNIKVSSQGDTYCPDTNMTIKLKSIKLPSGYYYVNDEGEIWKFLRRSYDERYNIYGFFTPFNYKKNKYLAYLNKPICSCGKCGIEYESTTLEL